MWQVESGASCSRLWHRVLVEASQPSRVRAQDAQMPCRILIAVEKCFLRLVRVIA